MKTNSNLGLLILGGAGLVYFMSAGKAKAVPARTTTGSAKPIVESFDKLFSNRAQQPILGGASGGSSSGFKASADLTGVAMLVAKGIGKLASGIGSIFRPDVNTNVTKTPYYSTWADRDSAMQAAALQRDGPVDDWYNGANQGTSVPDDYSSSAYPVPYDTSASTESYDYGDSSALDDSFASATAF